MFPKELSKLVNKYKISELRYLREETIYYGMDHYVLYRQNIYKGKDKKIRGLQRHYFPSGIVSTEEYYKDGKRNGEYKEWFSNRILAKEGIFKDGNLDGEYKEWWYNGKLKTKCSKKNGVFHGLCESWKLNGELLQEIMFSNGVKESPKFNVLDME